MRVVWYVAYILLKASRYQFHRWLAEMRKERAECVSLLPVYNILTTSPNKIPIHGPRWKLDTLRSQINCKHLEETWPLDALHARPIDEWIRPGVYKPSPQLFGQIALLPSGYLEKGKVIWSKPRQQIRTDGVPQHK